MVRITHFMQKTRVEVNSVNSVNDHKNAAKSAKNWKKRERVFSEGQIKMADTGTTFVSSRAINE